MADRQDIILNATLELVSEHSLLGPSISQIAKRAKASPGIIYHYFDSKDEIMHSLYLKVFKELMDTLALSEEEHEKLSCLERLKEIWLRSFDFHISNPMKTKFIEQYKSSSYFTKEQEQATNMLLGPLIIMIQKDITQGDIQDLPLRVVHAMTMGVADSVAKSQIAGALDLKGESLEKVADTACKSVLV